MLGVSTVLRLQCFIAPHLWVGGMVAFEVGHSPISEKNGWANFFENMGMRVSGAFSDVFMIFNNPKNPNFSSLAPSALASHLFTPLAGCAQKQGIRESVRLTLCSF